MNTQYVIVASVILIVIMFTTLSATKTFSPYDGTTIFTHNYPYEGFAQMHHALDYGTNPDGKSTDSYTPFLINSSANECKKVYGFDGLYCSPNKPDVKLDLFSGIEGSPSCVGKSSGLTNSKGGLCLDAKHIAMLKTRGGNQTVMEAEIGH